MVKKLALVIVFIVLGISFAFAQLPGIGKLGRGKTSGRKGVSLGELSGSKTKVVSTYLESTKELATSLEKAGEALGVKKEVLEQLAVVKALNEGNINDQALEKARKASKSVYESINQKMEETTALSVESKKLLAESIVHLVNGIQKEQKLIDEVQNLSNQSQTAIRSASPTEVLKIREIAGTALTLVKAIPLDLKLTKDILSTYIQYAKANNISVPSNATDLLKGD